nr:DUF4465 domain-containing protein [uncultured Carboxylicivirga sp.]
MKFKSIIILAAISLAIVSCFKDDKPVPAPTIYLSMPVGGFDVDIDSTFIIEPKITYDVSSSYEWTLNDEIISTERDFKFTDYDYGSYQFHFKITTPSGSDTMTIPVHAMDICSFEEFTLKDSSFHYYPEEGFYSWKYAQLSNNYNGNNRDWSGFAISKGVNKTSGALSNQFSVYYASGAESSTNFGVFKQSDEINHKISFTDGKAHQLESMEVNNSTLAYLTMNQGFNRRDTVDFFLLTINGYDDSNTLQQSIKYYLADYRYGRTSEKYIVSNWETVDLSALGKVNTIDFQLTSSFDTSSVYTMPKYVCFDNLKIKD